MQFLDEEGGADLMHRYGRGEGGKYEQCIEQNTDSIAHRRHAAECLLEHVGQGDEDEWPESGSTPTEKAAGKIMSPAMMAINVSMSAICVADFSRLVSRLK